MKTNENQKSTNHQPATQKPFFGATSDHAFFSEDRAGATPFFQHSSAIQAKSAAIGEAEGISQSVVQRKPAFESEVNDLGAVQRSPLTPQKLPQHPPTETPTISAEDRIIQAKGEVTGNSQMSSEVQRPNLTGLPDRLKTGIENISGYSMDDVKVRYNSDQPAQLQAHAYAQGTEIHIASGQEKHLPHEAWHVVQQKQGRVKPTMQMKGKVNINDDAGLEKEADVMGNKAVRVNTSSTNQSMVVNHSSFSPAVEIVQAVWEELDRETLYWTPELDGVTWYVNRLGMMWFVITNNDSVEIGNIESYRRLEGKIRSWNEWNQISVAPDKEWLSQQTKEAQEAMEEQERLESSNSSGWRTGQADKAFQAAGQEDKRFNTGHHKIAKSTIEWIYQNMSEKQKFTAKKVLDLPSNAGLKSFQSLFSNVTFGPESGLRSEDPKRALDPNTKGTKLKRTLTPRSLEYFVLNGFIASIDGPGSGQFNSKVKRGFNDDEFEFILDKLQRAEKKHAIITGGGGLDTNISMWEQDQSNVEKPWSKKDVDVLEIKEQQLESKSVRDLKNPKHRAVDANPRTFSIPIGGYLKAGMSKHDYDTHMSSPDSPKRREIINNGILQRNLHRMIMNKPTSKSGSDNWHHHWQYLGPNHWEWNDGKEQWEINSGIVTPKNEAARREHERGQLEQDV